MDADQEHLEQLLARALEVLEEHGSGELHAFLERHPEEADHLRAAMADLHRLDMLEAGDEGLPTRFGDFVVRAQLGAGGMGVVYLAEQEPLGREVAVKAIRPELLLFEGARERFRREIDAVARLDHPSIVPILASGTTSGVPYYAMPRLRGLSGEAVLQAFATRAPEELDGRQLAELLGRRAEDPGSDGRDVFSGSYWRAIVALIQKAALGVEHAHVRGVLHRDLKPSNIMLSPGGDAVVLDFGLAHARGDARMTRSGAAAGSPAYMSPEQLRGEAADERSDVYTLGATLHCLLALQPPFPLESSEVLRGSILAGDRRPLRGRTDAPEELLVVLASALDVDRGRRYASARAFADDLAAVLSGAPIQARRLPLAVRARRYAMRHRGLTAAAGVSLVFLMLVPLLMLWQQREAGVALNAQVEKTAAANSELARTNTDLQAANRALAAQVEVAEQSRQLTLDAITRLLTGLQTQKLRNQVGAQRVAAQMLEDALDLFDELDDHDPDREHIAALRLSTLDQLIGLENEMGRVDAAARHVDEGLTLVDKYEQSPTIRLHRARLQLRKAALHANRGARDPIAPLLAAARATLEALIEEGHADTGTYVRLTDALMMQARMQEERGAPGEAGALYAAAVQAAERTQRPDANPTSWMRSRFEQLKFLRRQRRLAAAMEAADALIEAAGALPLRPRMPWPVPRLVVAQTLGEKHTIAKALGDTDAALDAAEESLQHYDRLIAAYRDMPSLLKERGGARCNLAVLLAELSRHEEALPWIHRAIRDQEAALRAAPKLQGARSYLQKHRLLLTICLRETGRWSELEEAVCAFAALGPPANWLENATWDLLRCAARAEHARQTQLHDLAFEWLASCRDAGHRLRLDHAVYDPIRADARFAGLR